MKTHRLNFALLIVAAGVAFFCLDPKGDEDLGASPSSMLLFNQNHNCTYCHDIHGNSNPTLLRDSEIEDLCLGCHGGGGISIYEADTHNVGHGIDDITCIVCHNPHSNPPNWLGGTNLKLFGWKVGGVAQVVTPNSGIRNVVFESRGTRLGMPTLHSFADNDEDGNGFYDGACESCHTEVDFHHNNPSGNHSHHTGDTCTRCHDHADGFKKP